MARGRLDQVDAMRPMKQAGVISTHVLTFFVPAAASVSTSAVMRGFVRAIRSRTAIVVLARLLS